MMKILALYQNNVYTDESFNTNSVTLKAQDWTGR